MSDNRIMDDIVAGLPETIPVDYYDRDGLDSSLVDKWVDSGKPEVVDFLWEQSWFSDYEYETAKEYVEDNYPDLNEDLKFDLATGPVIERLDFTNMIRTLVRNTSADVFSLPLGIEMAGRESGEEISETVENITTQLLSYAYVGCDNNQISEAVEGMALECWYDTRLYMMITTDEFDELLGTLPPDETPQQFLYVTDPNIVVTDPNIVAHNYGVGAGFKCQLKGTFKFPYDRSSIYREASRRYNWTEDCAGIWKSAYAQTFEVKNY